MAYNSECDDKFFPEIQEDSLNNDGGCDLKDDSTRPEDGVLSENSIVSKVAESQPTIGSIGDSQPVIDSEVGDSQPVIDSKVGDSQPVIDSKVGDSQPVIDSIDSKESPNDSQASLVSRVSTVTEPSVVSKVVDSQPDIVFKVGDSLPNSVSKVGDSPPSTGSKVSDSQPGPVSKVGDSNIVSKVSEDHSQDPTRKESQNPLDETLRQEMAKLRFPCPGDSSDTKRSECEDANPDEERTRSTPSPDSDVNDNDYQEEKTFVPPTELIMEKIVKQVESYFTDFNIMKDKFLFKHIRRNKEGYISLKLVASFRRVKTLTKDWRVVRYSLQHSKKLQLNAEGTKIKRIEPVPNFEDTRCAKTVLVFNLPFENPTSDCVKMMMLKYGGVAEVTVVIPGNNVPDVCTKRCLSYYKELASKTFALVEFTEYSSALAAMKAHEIPPENQMKVVPLLSDAYKNKAKSVSPKKDSKSPKSDSPMSDRGDRKTYSRRRPPRSRLRVEEIKTSGSPTGSSDSLVGNRFSPNAKKSPSQQHEKNLKTSSLAQNSPKAINQNASLGNKSDAFLKPNNSKSNSSPTNDVTSSYSWMPRRVNAKNVNHLNQSSNHRLQENVLRLPRGPDGTNGFQSKRISNPEMPATATTDITDVIKNFIASH